MRRRRNRRWFLWPPLGALLVAAFWELLWRWASRESRWIETYYNGITGSWEPPSHKGRG